MLATLRSKLFKKQCLVLYFVVLKNIEKAASFGMQWLEHVKLNWQKVYCMQVSVSGVLEKHTDVFGKGLGMLKGTTASTALPLIYVESDQPLKFFKPISIPCALKKKLEQELNTLVQTKVIHQERYSDWATPIVPVLKEDGKVRVCGDYKLTVN